MVLLHVYPECFYEHAMEIEHELGKFTDGRYLTLSKQKILLFLISSFRINK
jgi:hypothetical protein